MKADDGSALEGKESFGWESCVHCGREWKVYLFIERVHELHEKELTELRKACLGPEGKGQNQFAERYEKEFFDPALSAFGEQGCGYFGIEHQQTSTSTTQKPALIRPSAADVDAGNLR